MEPVTGTAAIVVLGAQIIARVIPDRAGGILGIIRKVAKVVGLYVENRK